MRGSLAAGLLLVPLILAGCLGGVSDPEVDPRSDARDTLAWGTLASEGTPRTEVTAAVFDGRIYVLGGFTGDGTAQTLVEVLDPVTATWSVAPNLPIPLHHTAAVAVPPGAPGAGLYVLGGFTTPPTPGPLPAFVPTPLVFHLAPGAEAWEPVAPLPEARAAHGAALVDGLIYVVGGYDGSLQMDPDVYTYDPATDAWGTVAPLPTPREHVGAAALDGRLYVPGGELGSHAEGVDVLEVYDPATDTWETLASMPTARGSNTVVAWQGLIVVAGGQDTETTFDEVEAYDPATDTWTVLSPLPTPRHGLGGAAAGGDLYILLGGPEPGLSVTGVVEVLPATANRAT